MKILKCVITNFRAIEGSVSFYLYDYNVIVGKNDVGKSTVLKAIDLFLNENEALPEIQNFNSEQSIVEIEIYFTPPLMEIIIDEKIKTTFKAEELLDKDGVLSVKKVWDTTKNKIKPQWYIKRKIYAEHDFINETEKNLIKLCDKLKINTHKANGDEFNNSEKRQKLREHHRQNNISFTYDYEELKTTGTTRSKLIYEALKNCLPRFEYFKADTSLTDSDKSIQNYFKKLSEKKLEEYGLNDIQKDVQEEIEKVLKRITDKINQVVPSEEKVQPCINFDWSNFLKVSFRTNDNDKPIPLYFRGDGFRRITMMSYFEYLAEENKNEHQNIIFGFEEPETFLHPSAQEQLFEKLINMTENGYQVLITSHSPTIIAKSSRDKMMHIVREANKFVLNQTKLNISKIIKDLGISVENQFIKEFEKSKMLILVEGIRDVNAFQYTSKLYKDNKKIQDDFKDKGIVFIPIGGCNSIQHWVALDLINALDKPFFIIQDSDKVNLKSQSNNEADLKNLGFKEKEEFHILYKRNLENYLNLKTIKRLIPNIDLEERNWHEWSDIKKICKTHRYAVKLGGKKVAEKFFAKQSFIELKESFTINGTDEFITIYNEIMAIYNKKYEYSSDQLFLNMEK